jgi:type I restriction-modification system DNA methylase subunit
LLGGSAGFLCESFDYLKRENPKRTTAQDRLLQERTFYGKEKKSLAYVIAIMNMILHGIEAPNIPKLLGKPRIGYNACTHLQAARCC